MRLSSREMSVLSQAKSPIISATRARKPPVPIVMAASVRRARVPAQRAARPDGRPAALGRHVRAAAGGGVSLMASVQNAEITNEAGASNEGTAFTAGLRVGF